MKKALIMLTFALTGCEPVEPDAKEYHSPKGQTLPYRLQGPSSIKPGAKYPLVLLLHGAGERGKDNHKQLVWFWNKNGPSLLTRPELAEAHAFTVSPQCPEGKQWVNAPWEKGSYKTPEISEPLQLALDLVDSLMKELPIDPDRVYVMGLSMGGFGTFDAIQRRPDLFAAAAPVCGAGDPTKAAAIAHIPIWVFHGEKDTVVPPTGSREMVAALKAAGGHPRYTEYPGVGHNSWVPAFAEKELWSWMFAQKRAAKKK